MSTRSPLALFAERASVLISIAALAAVLVGDPFSTAGSVQHSRRANEGPSVSSAAVFPPGKLPSVDDAAALTITATTRAAPPSVVGQDEATNGERRRRLGNARSALLGDVALLSTEARSAFAESRCSAVRLPELPHTEFSARGCSPEPILPPPDAQTAASSAFESLARRLLQCGLSRIVSAFDSRSGREQDELRRASSAFDAFWKTLKRRVIHVERSKFEKELVILAPMVFWTTLRATATCRSVVRSGEAWDGDKFICNADCLVPSSTNVRGAAAVTPTTTAATSSIPIFVSIGSFNDFSWELAVLKSWPTARIMTFDCTVANPAPPEECRGRCVFLKLCVGSKPGFIRFEDFPRLFNEHFPPVVMGTTTNGSPQALHHIALLKVDIEGAEFEAIPQWVNSILSGNAKITVHQLQLEVHRSGSSRCYSGLQSMHLLFLGLYSIGFIPVRDEINLVHACCAEYVWVNATWWMEAEVATHGDFYLA